MQSNVMSSFRAGFVFLLLVGTSMAGPLPTDPAAISGWQGTSVFSGKNGLGTINLTIYGGEAKKQIGATNEPAEDTGNSSGQRRAASAARMPDSIARRL